MQRTLFTSAVRAVARSTPSSGVRHASNLPIPPKVATPTMVSSGGASKRMEGVVAFYKSLPKSSSPKKSGGGIKARFFDGKNASGKPIIATIGALLLIGYTIDYNMHLKHHKNNHH